MYARKVSTVSFFSIVIRFLSRCIYFQQTKIYSIRELDSLVSIIIIIVIVIIIVTIIIIIVIIVIVVIIIIIIIVIIIKTETCEVNRRLLPST